MKAEITGVGSYLPQRRMANEEFATFLDTSDEWIRSHTGIRFRHIAAEGESASDLGVAAARRTLERAGVKPSELDLILVATSTGDYRGFPATACLIQDRLGAGQAGAMDLGAACTGFVYALETARAFVHSGSARHILVVGTEVMSKILDWKDRNTCVLFGDGAGAVVVSAGDGSSGVLDSILGSDGKGAPVLTLPISNGQGPKYLTMDGGPVYSFAVRIITDLIRDMLARNDLAITDLTAIVPHQANLRIITAAAKRLGAPVEMFFTNIAEVANTSAASIPIALDAMLEQNRLKKGDLIMTVGFGAGLTYGANLIRW